LFFIRASFNIGALSGEFIDNLDSIILNQKEILIVTISTWADCCRFKPFQLENVQDSSKNHKNKPLKIIIAGAGEVGYHLIEDLYSENVEIFVTDNDPEVLEKLKADYQVQTELANIIDSSYLNRDHLEDADLFLAITNSDETNMIACKMAAEAGVKKTICRIRQVDFSSADKEFALDTFGIDVVINPISIVAEELYNLVLVPNVVDSHRFMEGSASLAGYNITEHASILNKSYGEIAEDLENNFFQIAIIQRNAIPIVPSKDERIELGDIVYFYCRTTAYQALRRYLGYTQRHLQVKRVFINGGGPLGVNLAKRLEASNIEVRIIENDIKRSHQISEILGKTWVLNFDGTDKKQLIAAGIEYADYFFSLTGNDQVNLSACLIAAQHEVERTLCLVKQPELIPILSQKTPISLGICPRLLTARHLARFIQDSTVFSYFSIGITKFEVLELNLDESTPCLGISLQDLQLPGDVRIGFIKRNNELIIPTGDNSLLAGDSILLTLHRMERDQTLRYFKPGHTKK